MREIFTFISLSICMASYAQSGELDSIKEVFYSSIEHDTIRAEAAILVANEIYYTNFDEAILLLDSAENLVHKKHEVWAGRISHSKAKILQRTNHFGQSFQALQKAEDYFKLAGFTSGHGHVYIVKGNIYLDLGEYDSAMDAYIRAAELFEKINHLDGQAIALSGIGDIHSLTGNSDKAILYYKKAIKMDRAQDYQRGIASSMTNMGGAFHRLLQYDTAKYYYETAGEIHQQVGNKIGHANVLNNLGLLLMDQGHDLESVSFFEKSLAIHDSLGSAGGKAIANRNLGSAMFNMGNYSKTIVYCQTSKQIAINDSLIDDIREACDCLREVYFRTNDYKNAYVNAMLAHELKDSISNVSSMRSITQRELKYGFNKVLLKDSLAHQHEIQVEKAERKASEAEKDAEIQQGRWVIFAGIGGLLIMVLYAIVLWRSNNQKKKANAIIKEQKVAVELQKEIVEERNHEIMDSLKYAKRIQSAILPPKKIVKQYLDKSFILYKPKDVVAGDFYWMEPVNENVIFAAADCTGHGVPGAMVSVICNNGLNRSVREHGLLDPGKILDKTREIVISEFEKSEEEVKDGMDIALCSLNGLELKYAGANNPLWIIRNGEIIETKANKQPIGKYTDPKPFITHTIQLQKGDTIYIFSDGYVDQFGGEKGKKFKPSNFRKLLLSMQNDSMESQRELLDEAFEAWRGELEQIDDVCVIGVRIE